MAGDLRAEVGVTAQSEFGQGEFSSPPALVVLGIFQEAEMVSNRAKSVAAFSLAVVAGLGFDPTKTPSALASAWAACKATEKQLVAARAYFNLIDKGFKEGANSLLEFMDARNQLTTSALQRNIDQYNYV